MNFLIMFKSKKAPPSEVGSMDHKTLATKKIDSNFSLDMNRSPLFSRRQETRDNVPELPPKSKLSSQSLRVADKESVQSKLPLKRSGTLPLGGSDGLFPLSPVVTKILSPQPKEVLVNKLKVDVVSPIYDDVYESDDDIAMSDNKLEKSQEMGKGGAPETPVSPFYPITPLSGSISPFIRNKSSGIKSPIVNPNAVVFNNFESFRNSASAENSSLRKLNTLSVSVSPHAPVTPIDIKKLDELQLTEMAKNPGNQTTNDSTSDPIYQEVKKKGLQDTTDSVEAGNDSPSRFTRILNNRSISKMPEELVDELFHERFKRNVNSSELIHEEPPDFKPPASSNTGMSLDSMICTRCGEGFEPQEKIVNSNGQLWHTQCFVCSQCFRAFPDDVFYEFEGRRYCEHDFQVLFAPCCGKCNEFIIGRVIKAMNNNWHPGCFTCTECNKELADLGFIKYMNRAVCHDCNASLKARSDGKHVCRKCHAVIDGEPLRWRGDTYHPYHFNCSNCDVELTHQAREVKSRPGYTANQMNELYCLRCHDKMGIPICGACRRPIEERVVTALGKHWHVEHFVCGKCEKPFLGNRHYEKKGQAYCEVHYHELFGNLCFVCNQVIYGDVVTALNKAWCTHHFACSLCDVKMTQKTKFFEFDQKPICKKCYEKLPQELKKRLKKQHDIQARGGKPVIAQ